jgi:hypothetical protein
MFGIHKAQFTMRPLLIAAPLVLITLANVHAQSGRPAPTPQRPDRGVLLGSTTMQVELPTPVAETPVPLVSGRPGELQTLSFTTPDANFERVLVKGAAFSADSLTEHFQILSDGNRMGRKSVAHIYRDAMGRTRREHELGANSLAPDGEPPREIIINDPVGQVNYIIDTRTGEARKMILPPARVMEAMQRAMGDNAPFSVLMPTSTAHRRMAEGDAAATPLPQPVREKLTPQTIEGVMAEGTRITLTIPAGEFDNEKPMVITHEEWYAPELHLIVMMKHGDPRFGETTFKLTNILRGEPSPDLFQLPPGYRVVEGRGRAGMIGPGERPPLVKRP